MGRGVVFVRRPCGPQRARLPRGRRAVAASAVLLLAGVVGGCSPERPPLTFSPDVLPDGRVGQPYDQRITIAGNETPVYLWSVQNGLLPAGLAIERVAGDNHTGHIVGTPTVAGTATFEVYVACNGTNVSGQTGVKAYTLTIR